MKMKPCLTVWPEFRWTSGGSDCYVLSAQEPGKKGRGARLCSRAHERDILSLKRELEESESCDIN